MKLLILAIFLGITFLLEVSLRRLFGFGNPLVYITDEKIGYLLAPNQQTRRFGNQIEINQYSMRSPPINEELSPPPRRILLLGDSVANGGWWTNQTDTISSLMIGQLQALSQGKTENQENKVSPLVEVLNASANSWGPRNQLAYLQRFGVFASQVVVLLINTDDLFAIAPTSLPVGNDRNYPDKKPPLALVEVFSRYVLPTPALPAELKTLQAEPGDRVGHNLDAIQQIHQIVKSNGSYFLLAMTPLKREVDISGSYDYEKTARQRLEDFAKSQEIPYLDFLPVFQADSQPARFYRDHIHLSPAGNQKVSQCLSEKIAVQI